jgi:hypothetical protein
MPLIRRSANSKSLTFLPSRTNVLWPSGSNGSMKRHPASKNERQKEKRSDRKSKDDLVQLTIEGEKIVDLIQIRAPWLA